MLTQDQIDDLLTHSRFMAAMQAIMERTGCSLREAIDAVDRRSGELWDSRPEDFTVSREEYGHGIHS